MTFQELYDKLGELTPEQRQQDIIFVKYGASLDYDWDGIPYNGFYEDSKRFSLEIAEGGSVYLHEDHYNKGVPNCDYDTLLETIDEEEDTLEEIVPAGMPFFSINEE